MDPKQQNAEMLRIIGRNKERLHRSQKVLQDLTGRTEFREADPPESAPADQAADGDAESQQ